MDMHRALGRDPNSRCDILEEYLNNKPSTWRLITAYEVWHEGMTTVVTHLIWWVGDTH